MSRFRGLLPAVALIAGGACSGPIPVKDGDTDYFREQVALARTARPVVPGEEAKAVREAAEALRPLADASQAEIDANADAEGLLDLSSPAAKDVMARASDPAKAEALLSAGPLELETVLLAAYARNPDVAAAKATWRSTVRMYDQATYLEDLLLRYRAFAKTASPAGASKAMGEAAFPYPGVVALKGEMIAAEVRMMREDARMRVRDVLAAAAMAWVEAGAKDREVKVEGEQVSLLERAVSAARARASTGSGMQADLLETETELAMAKNRLAQAAAAAAAAKGRLDTLLARDPTAPIAVAPAADPPAETPALAPLLDLAAKYAPETRAARAEAERTAVAIRMAEAMLFAPPPLGSAAGLGMPENPAGTPPAKAPAARPGGGAANEGMGTMGGSSGGTGAAKAPPMPAGGMPAPGGAEVPPAAPATFGGDLAWVAELRERKVALDRAVEEAARKAARDVVAAHLDLDAARRMFALAAKTTVPLARQAAEERLRLYESTPEGFAEVVEALRRSLSAREEEISARQMYGEAEAKAWMAAGARPAIVAGTPAKEGDR